MTRTLVLCALLAALPAGLLFPQGASAWIGAADILHIGGGEIGAVVAGAELDGDAGFSAAALRLVSTIDAVRFSAEAVSAAVHVPLKDIRIGADISAAALHDINICDTATFESAGMVTAGVSARIPLFGGAGALSPFCKAGRLCASGGRAYGFKAVPELSPFFLFGASVSFPALTVLLQGGVSDIAVRSEAESGIDSSGFQRQFLLLCGNKIDLFDTAALSWWGGALYTNGKVQAQTERGDASICAENQFLAIGTGAQFSSEGGRFFWSAGLHFLFLPLGFARAEFACDIKLLFTTIQEQFAYTFDSAGEYGLLLPRVSGGVRFLKSGRVFIDKTFYVPLHFFASSSGGGGSGVSSGGGSDMASLFVTALLSGLSLGIKI